MNLATDIAASRLIAAQHAMAVTADNIANMSTPGYRAERVLFSDWLSPQIDTAAPPGGSVLAYTQDRATWRETTPGPIRHTGNPLDIAITGPGYFTVQTPRGTRLTRDGRFGLLPDGSIADAAGDRLLDSAGQPIHLAPTDTDLTIAGDGTLSSRNGRIAKIGVVAPKDPMRLVAEGGSLLRAKTPLTPVAAPHLVQGAVEGSDVQPVLELTRMINQSRQFQFVTQFVQAEDDRQKNAIENLAAQGNG